MLLEQLNRPFDSAAAAANLVVQVGRSIDADAESNAQAIELQQALFGEHGRIRDQRKRDSLVMQAGLLPRVSNCVFKPFIGQQERFTAVKLQSDILLRRVCY